MKKLLLAIVVMALTACATMSPVAKPKVAITSIGLGEPTGLQQRLSVGLQLDNPNGFNIDLGRFRYDLKLAGKSLAGGSYNQPLRLPANERVNLVVPVDVNLLSGLGLISSILSAPGAPLDYELSLTANVTTFGFGDITISKNGQVGLGMPAPESGTPTPQ